MKTINYNVLTTRDYGRAFAARMRGKRNLTAENVKILDEAAITLSPVTLPFPYDGQAEFALVRKNHSVFRKLCKTVNVSQGDNSIWVTDRTTGAEWLAPGDLYPLTDEGITKRASTAHKLGCNVTLSEDLANDSRFDLVDFLADVVGRRFALAEDKGFVSGTGEDGQVSGLTNQGTAVDVSALDYAALLEIYHAVPSEYRTGGTWILSDTTAETIRGLLDDAGRPLLDVHNGLTLFGRPAEICAGCADDAVLFGDLSTVWLLDRAPLFVQPLSELYAVNQELGFHCWSLLDIVATRPEAVAVATVPATEA